MPVELELIEQDELLEGLMSLTGNNLGLSCELLKKVIKKTECEIQTTLKEIADNVDVETRRARRRALYALNKNMSVSANHPLKPRFSAAHHIVAWNDSRAEKALKILIKWDIDVHDEINSVYLPRYEKHTPHKNMPDAVAHSKMHTNFYHINVVAVLVAVDIPGAVRDSIVEALREIAEDLQDGVFPINEPLVLK